MEYSFRNLVFEGGGSKATAYAGALLFLKEKKILDNIKRIGGTSSGAITGLLVGLNYNTDEIIAIINQLDFSNFLDDNWGVVSDTERLINKFGWYKGDLFRKWVANIIADKTGNPNATFNDIQDLKEQKGFKDMYFIGTNLSTGYSEVFSFEHTPYLCVADAVRISMSIPLFFVAPRSLSGDYYTDGGVLNNYPIQLFDRQKYVDQFSNITSYYQEHNNSFKSKELTIDPFVFNQETLGFRFASTAEIGVFRDHTEPQYHEVSDLLSFTWRVIDTLLESQNDRHLHSDDWERTIYIDTLDVKTMDFDLTDEKKTTLIEAGYLYTEKYFAWYDSLHKSS